MGDLADDFSDGGRCAYHDDGSTDIKPEGYKEPDWSKMFDTQTKETVKKIYAQREEILTAFVAKYGCEPDQVEQVLEMQPTKMIFYVQKRRPDPKCSRCKKHIDTSIQDEDGRAFYFDPYNKIVCLDCRKENRGLLFKDAQLIW